MHDFVNIIGCSLETVQGRMLGHISLERYTIWLTAAVDENAICVFKLL